MIFGFIGLWQYGIMTWDPAGGIAVL
jgi:hypothetical protein